MSLNNAVLPHKKVAMDTQADAVLNLTQPLLENIFTGKTGLKDALFGEDLSMEGSKLDLINFFSLLDTPKGTLILLPHD